MGGRGKSRSSSRGSRRGRKNIQQNKKDEEDRISNLPDDLIINHILSYLHSNVAVQTTVLSKRWKNLWTTLPCLNFERGLSSNYENLVRNFLENRDQESLLSQFTIDGKLGGEEMLKKCLDYVISNDVEYLCISNGDLTVYPGLFNSACLKTKTSLTSLHLVKVRIGKQVLEFENLRDLTLVETCIIDADDMYIFINCQKLRSLTLNMDLHLIFFVTAPSLLYFSYCSGQVPRFFATRDGFPCIKQVHIDIKKDDSDFFKYYYETGYYCKNGMQMVMNNFISMLKAVRETPFLELSSETIEGLRLVPYLWKYEHSSLANLKIISLRGPGLFDTLLPRTMDHVTDYLLTNSPCAKIITRL
ncbi:putative F-box/LRR-repeat protein At4g15060 [Apium graveolens]|uniref:putative F-box/LRR-repeat protein At4g15060 n=1 Tax=Apium graveolens TaxID=4045 RepID=UPI003D7B3B71